MTENKIDKKMLFDFFMWFRENGEKHIDKSIEQMIDIYVDEAANQDTDQ